MNKEIQYKNYAIKEVNEEKREFTVVLTTNKVDRDGERVHIPGFKFKDYLEKNPVIVLDHDTKERVGKALSIKPDSRATKVIMTGKFADKGTVPAADIEWERVKQGITSAVSMGFMVLATRRPTAKEIEKYGEYRTTLYETNLVEISFVGVPANEDARVISHKNFSQKIEKDIETKEKELLDHIKKELRYDYQKQIKEKELIKIIKEELIEKELYKKGIVYY